MKLKADTKKRIRGSITILLVLILLPMMTFSALIVDLSRVNMAREMISSAGDLTMNTALANYDTILKDVYGLFAMSQNKTEEELEADLKDYFVKTISSYGVVEEEDADDYVSLLFGDFSEIVAGVSTINTTDFLEMTDVTLTADRVDNSSLASASVLRKQIVEYMKYRAPLNFGMSFLDSLKSFQTVSAQNDVVETQVKAQESTQDVTQACSKLIKLIREYDNLVTDIDSGALAVKGLNSCTDGVVVPLADYDTQVDKYLSAWGDDTYTRINQLNLVFLANSPSVDSVYLKGLNYGSSVYFIKSGGAGLVYDGSGINISPTLAEDTSSAKTQVENQITNLNNNYKAIADTYENSDASKMGPAYLNYNLDGFSDEQAAINMFIAFEKFLLNQSGEVTYSQVKEVLEQVYILGKYYDNYKEKIDAAVNEALEDLNAANTAVTNAQNYASQRETWNDGIARDINNKLASYRQDNSYSFLNSIDTTLYNTINSVITSSIPTPTTKTVSGRTFYDYGNTYYSMYYLRNAGDAEDKYMLAYKDLALSTALKNQSETYKKICEAAYSYLSYNGSNSFETYMKDKAGNSCTDNELYKLLACLYYCSSRRVNAAANISEYITNMNGYSQLVSAAAAAKTDYDTKVADRNLVTSNYNSCLSGFFDFGRAYQENIYYYSRYITTARNITAKEAQNIKTQFSAILMNVAALQTKLNAISTQIGVVKSAIEQYNDNLDAWENANNTYESENSSDSFSKQTASDIETARSEYDEDSYDTLNLFVNNLLEGFNSLYARLNDTVHYKYGSKKINAVSSADDLISAVSDIKSTLPAVVTTEDAGNKLPQLYNSEPTPEYVPFTVDYQNGGQLCFLSPNVVQIQVLKYLNSAYPDETNLTQEQIEDNEAAEADYEEQKDKLINGSSSSDEGDESNTNSSNAYGYTYENIDSISSDDLPSKGAGKKTVEESEYTLTETGKGDDAQLDASTSVGQQSTSLDDVLSGIGNVATAALENAYILNYIFENFSYNTMIQDAVMDNVDLNGLSSGAQLVKAEEILGDSSKLENYVGKLTTLSNFPKNGANNYIYGAEVEYILFGDTNPAKNVTYAKASIYAIRFGFNCIYAFTNSEIRNTTMAAGLAVQAATLGIVPYQVVQIVLQLALAAAESAVDLDMMNHGLTVAVVKSTDTWSISVSGAANTAKTLVAQVADNAVDKLLNDSVSLVTNGLQALVDATAGELTTAIYDVSSQLQIATQKALTDVVDQAFAMIMKEVEDGLNSLQYVDTTVESVKSRSDAMFQNIKSSLHEKLQQLFGDNDLASLILPKIEEYANNMITNVQTEVNNTIENTPSGKDVTEYISAEMANIKQMMVEKATEAVNDAMASAIDAATNTVESVQGELNDYIDQVGEDMSEQAAEEIKKKIQETTNQYIGEYLDPGNFSTVGGSNATQIGGSTSSSVAAMFKFGYKDYLMLLTYVSICTSDSVLLRTSDIIQLNIQNAGDGASYTHSKGSDFKMENAATYISIEASANLDMFFLDLDLFENVLEDDAASPESGGTTDTTGEINAVSTIKYKGLLGY